MDQYPLCGWRMFEGETKTAGVMAVFASKKCGSEDACTTAPRQPPPVQRRACRRQEDRNSDFLTMISLTIRTIRGASAGRCRFRLPMMLSLSGLNPARSAILHGAAACRARFRRLAFDFQPALDAGTKLETSSCGEDAANSTECRHFDRPHDRRKLQRVIEISSPKLVSNAHRRSWRFRRKCPECSPGYRGLPFHPGEQVRIVAELFVSQLLPSLAKYWCFDLASA